MRSFTFTRWPLLTLTFLFLLGISSGCATYYEKNIEFQRQFVRGEMEAANKTLDKNRRAAKDKNRLLYFLQKGVVLQMLDDFEESNRYFEDAYIYSEDFKKKFSADMVSFLTNPGIKPYKGEDHEWVLMHYFKAINYLRLNDQESALVECRRINIKLNQLNDRYEKKKNRFKQDAFSMNLMGISFEASGEINDAFTAYRNAYECYKDSYQPNFDTPIPKQLKLDLLRTAYLNGFNEELAKYEKEFGQKHIPAAKPAGELVFFWHNGMGPVKDEWSLNFFIVKGTGGVVLFVNEELGLSIPFPLPPMGAGSGGLGDLKFVRVAFPKYLERKPYFRTAEIAMAGKSYPLEMGENINEIAFKTLEDRLVRELTNSLMRLALKQAAEQAIRQKNENVGALLSVLNAVSEKADTRNWQTLPYSISYARIPLAEGKNKVNLKLYSPQKSRNQDQVFEFDCKKGQTIFHTFHSLESVPIGQF